MLSNSEEEFKNNIATISLEINSACNRRCIYCPQSLIERPDVTMKAELLDKILHELININYEGSFCLNVYNEPLLHFPFLLNVIGKIKSVFPDSHIFFSTNGDLLTKPKLDYLISKCLSRLTITCHQNLFSSKNAEKLINSTMQKLGIKNYNLEIRKNYVVTNVKYNYGMATIPMRIFSSNFLITGQNRANALKNIIAPAKYKREQECSRPKTQITISYDGAVYPCCMFCHGAADKKYMLGNCAHDAIAVLYSSYLSKHFIDMGSKTIPYESPCSECTE